MVPQTDQHLRRNRQGEFHGGRHQERGFERSSGKHVHEGLAGVEEPMKLTALSLGLACALALLGRPLAADTARPDEDSLFGGASSAPVALSGTGTAVLSADKGGAQGGANSDKGGLSPDTLGHDDFANGSVKDDALQIGGTIYQQWIADESLYESPGNSAMSMPLQVDTYLDVRPNDRLRAYIDGRLMYDPVSYTHLTLP